MKRVLLAAGALLVGFAASARTFEMTLWRGETAAELLGGCYTLGADPAPLKVRVGTVRSVRYAPEPMGLQRRETLDRVVWDAKGELPRDGVTGGADRVVEVSVPADARPGVYTCGDLEITVLDRVLPPPKEWKYYLDLWQHPWASARVAGVKPFSPEHYAAMRPVYELLASAGQKTITVPIVDLPWDHQCYDAYHSLVEDEDFRLFDEYVEFCESCGLGPDISCYSLCPWALKLNPGTPEFEAYWKEFLERFAKHLREKGWYGRTLMAMDEREPEQVKAVVDFVHRYAPGLRIAMAGNRRPSEFEGIEIDNYCQLLTHVDDAFLAEAAARRRRGLVTTFYVCCSPTYPNTFMTSGPGEAFWLGAYPGVSGLDGFLRWAWNSWPQDPCADASFWWWAAGDTFLCYPGGEPSWRFLDLRNGVVAAEKLRILSADPAFAPELEGLRKLFDVSEAVAGRSDYRGIRRAVQAAVNPVRPDAR